MISKDENAINPIIEVKEDGYIWTIFASADTVIPRGASKTCSTGLRLAIPKGIVGTWKRAPPKQLLSLSRPLYKEDSGSSLKIELFNLGNALYYVRKGEIIIKIQFAVGKYERICKDHGRDIASVCALTPSAKKPSLGPSVGLDWHKYPAMSWRMYAAKEVTIPKNGDVIVPVGATFDIPDYLRANWDTCNQAPWHVLDLDHDEQGNSNTQQVIVMNYKPHDITIPKHSIVGTIRFCLKDGKTPHPYDLHPTASICSIAPGAKVSRENRADPWRVHPIETVVIPPYCKQTITTGVTFHVHPDYVGKWDSYPKDNRELVPVTVDYVKDPEVTVRNCSDQTMVIFPETPIATMTLQPDLKALNPVSL